MISRLPMIGLLLFAALLGEYGLPVWLGEAPIVPSLLDLSLLLACLGLAGGECVFWAGLIGLLQSDLAGRPLGPGIAVAATIALVSQIFFARLHSSRLLIDRLLCAAGLLLLLGAARVGLDLLKGTPVDSGDLIRAHAGRLAATFLLLLLCLGVSAAASFWRSRRHPLQELF